MRKRLKKVVHFAFPYYQDGDYFFYYCKGSIYTKFADFANFNDDEAYVTCKACKKEIKRKKRLEQGSKNESAN